MYLVNIPGTDGRIRSVKNKVTDTGETIQQSRALAVVAVDPGSDPSTHVSAHKHL